VLVGERAGAGALAAAGRLADAIGGKVAWVPRRSNARGNLEAGLAAGMLPGLRRGDDDTQRAEVMQVWGVDGLPESGNDLVDILTLAGKGRIKVLYLLGVDLAQDVADQRLVDKALKKATIITHDVVTNATTERADVVLPVTAAQERAGTRTNWEGRRQQFNKGVDGPRLAQHDWEVLVQVAGLLGADLGFTDLDGIRTEMARLAVAESATPDWPTVASTDPAADDSDDLALETYPLLLDNGVMQVDNADLAATARTPAIRLHPDDAAARGIADGDVVELSSRRASVTMAARLTSDQARGTVFVPANSGDDNPRHLAATVTVAAVPGESGGDDSADADTPQEVPA